jgi:diguanylate cyclase (GGDEF)-like protein
MMDLDLFKTVNDRFGHATGDVVLAAFASLLRRRLRHSDVLGRYGGEEFALLLEGLEESDVTRLANRLREEFGETEHLAPDGTRFRVGVSGGVAALDAATTSFAAWTKAADDALYAAKTQGRNRIVAAPAPRAPEHRARESEPGRIEHG